MPPQEEKTSSVVPGAGVQEPAMVVILRLDTPTGFVNLNHTSLLSVVVQIFVPEVLALTLENV